ncbi:MAG: hypothetical protein CL927_05260 [Deltaproteobacteria bacterium]|nr:hypothetical protein [Deltaproteobacteria bacterium]HCH61778.1 hypothetical protein [Deltaproteobacteria bacterium]
MTLPRHLRAWLPPLLLGGGACSVEAPGFPRAADFGSSLPGIDSAVHDTGIVAEAEVVTPVSPVVDESEWDRAVAVDGGAFEMGCTRDPDWNCYVDEFPVRTVTIRPTVVMAYEVTRGLYAAVMGTPSEDGRARHLPMTHITWVEAAAFANALSARDGLEPAYTLGLSATDTLVDVEATGWRLPTEAEWEYYARAGTDLTFAGSEDIFAVGWIDENSPYTLQPVGARAANAWGLHDLSGNAWEWTGDWLGPYPPEDEIDPPGFPEGSKKVVRGGSVENHASYARVSLRRLNSPDGTLACLSFRLTRTNGPSLRDPPPERGR